MKTSLLIGIIVLIFFLRPSAPAVADTQQPPGNRTENAASSTFEPVERWKAAVISGDRAALAGFYSKSPAARTKTPQGETQDPAEEPAFWSSLRRAGLSRFDLKVLEVENPQPGVMAIVLRCEIELGTGAGKKSEVVSGTQVWGREPDGWRIVSTQRSDPAASVPRRLPEPAKPNTHLYAAPELAPAEIAAALHASARDGKRVILIFGANWCYDCHVLDATFRSRRMVPLVTENYRVVHVNVGNLDQNLDLAKKYGIPLDKGIPSLAVLDPDGKLVVSQKQGEFESTTRIGPEDVAAFLNRWKPHRGV